jgi:hypothetical protein
VTSKLRCASVLRPSGTSRPPKTTTARPIGTLMRKIAGQPRPWVSTPPSRTPEVAPSPPSAPHTPSARLRDAPSSNDVVMIARLAAEITAPPTPWIARAPRRTAGEPAIAHMRDAAVNSAVPARNTRRRPRRSEARPPSRSNPAKVSVYALTTHCRPAVENPRPSWIAGSATFTIETSRITMNCARQTSRRSALESLRT